MKYKEFSKISIHNHIGGKESERKIDEQYDKELKFDVNKAISVIKDAKLNDYNMLAITNSNTFRVSDYLMTKFMAKYYNISILPGIELNISNDDENKFLHIIIIVDPKSNILKFSNDVNNKISINQKNYINIDQLVDIVLTHKVIIIPHGLKQSNDKKPQKDRSSASNVEQFKVIISMDDAIPIVMEDSKKYHKETLKIKLKEKLSEKEMYWVDKSVSISSSDRKKFDEIESPTYIWAGTTFDDLYFSVLMKNTRIKREEDIITKTSFISKIEIIPKIENPQITKSIIECSHGLNSIIGKSGSGKTLLLNAIKYNLTGENLVCRTSSISYYENVYKDVNFKFYDSLGKEIVDTSNWKIFEGENLYNKILQVYSSDKTKLIDELNLKINDQKFKNEILKFSDNISSYINNKNNIKNIKENIDKDLMSLLNNIKFLKDNKQNDHSITYLVNAEIENIYNKLIEQLKEIKSDLDLFEKLFVNLKRISKKYAEDEFLEEINNLEQKLKGKIIYKFKLVNCNKLKLKKQLLIGNSLYEIIKEYNALLGRKIEIIITKQQQNLKLIEKIKNEISELIQIQMKTKIPVLNIKRFENSLLLSNDTYSKLIIKNINFVINKEKFTTIFENSIGQARDKINLSEFKLNTIDLCDYQQMQQFLQIYIDNNYDNYIMINNDFNNYVEYELQLKNSLNDFENIETMSAGELSKTYINNLLDSNIKKDGSNLIILFDQPDSSLEKKFILNELVTKIDELRSDYQVFITTHEPLLVVNADSNRIIEATNNKSAISSKNKISYRNLSFVDKYDNKEKMINDIAELVDGSYDAIKDRTKIYGGMLNESNY